jgi:hypothetical protein
VLPRDTVLDHDPGRAGPTRRRRREGE